MALQQWLTNIDNAESAQLAATLAGLSLTAVTFYLAMGALARKAIATAALQEDTEAQNAAIELRTEFREAAKYMIDAIYGFLIALLVALGLDPLIYEGTGSALAGIITMSKEYGAGELVAQLGDLAVYTVPFGFGTWYLWQAVRVLGKHTASLVTILP